MFAPDVCCLPGAGGAELFLDGVVVLSAAPVPMMPASDGLPVPSSGFGAGAFGCRGGTVGRPSKPKNLLASGMINVIVIARIATTSDHMLILSVRLQGFLFAG